MHVSSAIVDLFHNSAAGYRAQYYHDPGNGEAANSYAVHQMVPRILQLLKGAEKGTCKPAWVQQSLLHPDAKLWIHQGPWLRHPRLIDKNLLVKRWLAYAWSELHKRNWARLTPEDEPRIDLKGGPATLDGHSYEGRLKPGRSEQISRGGFT